MGHFIAVSNFFGYNRRNYTQISFGYIITYTRGKPMTSTLLIVQIVLAIAITIAVLLQKSSSIGLGAYSGSNESVFGAKGPTGFLAKATFTLALLFIINTLALGYFYTSQNTASVTDTIVPANNTAVPAVPSSKSSAPSAPASK
jgi:preprotein translocase subunit SecG